MSHRPLARGRATPRTRAGGLALAGLLALAGCATYSARNLTLRADLAAGRFDAALQTVEKNRGERSLLLYHLERGLLLHYADRWQESNVAFQQAEELAADLYTKSLSQRALSLITSDMAVDYRADPFELAMVPYYRALNYVYLGDREEALVEARKASLLLRQYTEQDLSRLGELDPDRDTSADALLANDGFLHYFSGLLYEWGGETNDAFVAYRNAADAYHAAAGKLQAQPPPSLGADLARTAQRLGFRDELAQTREAFPELFPTGGDEAASDADSEGGDVVVLLELGYVPAKTQSELNLPILKTDQRDDRVRWARDIRGRWRRDYRYDETKLDYWLRVAVPELVSNRPAVTGARVSAGGPGDHVLTAAVEDLEGRAFAAFRAEEGTILLRTILRGLAKYGTQEKAQKLGEGAGILANILGAALETADTRGWLTLPNQIAMVRLRLPPGRHDLRVDLVNAAGRTVRSDTIPQVAVRRDDLALVSRRVF